MSLNMKAYPNGSNCPWDHNDRSVIRDRWRESGAAILGVLVVMGFFFLFFWSIGQVFSREWLLLHKKADWVKWQTSPVGQANMLELSQEIGGQRVLCNLYQQKKMIRERGVSGRYALNVSDCYQDQFTKLQMEVALSDVSPFQNISYSQYRYTMNEASFELSKASLVRFSPIETGGVSVVLEYAQQQYSYILPLLVDAETIEYRLVKGVEGGSAIVVNQSLWFLPFTESPILIAQELPFPVEIIKLAVLLSDHTGERGVRSTETTFNGIYFLIETIRSELVLYFFEFSGNWKILKKWDLRDVLIDNRARLSNRSIRWQVEQLDQSGVVLLLEEVAENDGHQQLMAIDWQGEPLWGSQVFWRRDLMEEVRCGLQQVVFEPVVGWILGCQRLRVGKMVVE